MTTLTEFLLARIAEDEQAAERVELCPYFGVDVGSGHVHLSRVRVLAECEAKRRSVERAQHAQSAQAAGVINPASIAVEIAWTDAIQLLAEVYADHADYDPTWLASD